MGGAILNQALARIAAAGAGPLPEGLLVEPLPSWTEGGEPAAAGETGRRGPSRPLAAWPGDEPSGGLTSLRALAPIGLGGKPAAAARVAAAGAGPGWRGGAALGWLGLQKGRRQRAGIFRALRPRPAGLWGRSQLKALSTFKLFDDLRLM